MFLSSLSLFRTATPNENKEIKNLHDYSNHGSRDRMWCPINWSKRETSNWYNLLIMKFYWLNFGCCSKATGMTLTPYTICWVSEICVYEGVKSDDKTFFPLKHKKINKCWYINSFWKLKSRNHALIPPKPTFLVTTNFQQHL